MSNTTGRKWEMRHIYIQPIQFKEQGKPRERSMEPRTQTQKLITKYPAPKSSKESCNKNKKINRLEVAGNSIIVAEGIEIVPVT